MVRMPLHQVDQVHARLERTHHASCRLVEHPIGNMIEQMTFELKVDHEVDNRLILNRRERPGVDQVLQRPLDGAHQHLSRSVQRDLAPETFLEWSKSDDKVGDDLSLILVEDTCAAAPRDEQWIVLYVCDDREKLVGTIGELRLLLMTRHVTPFPSVRDFSNLRQAGAITTLAHHSRMLRRKASSYNKRARMDPAIERDKQAIGGGLRQSIDRHRATKAAVPFHSLNRYRNVGNRPLAERNQCMTHRSGISQNRINHMLDQPTGIRLSGDKSIGVAAATYGLAFVRQRPQIADGHTAGERAIQLHLHVAVTVGKHVVLHIGDHGTDVMHGGNVQTKVLPLLA